MNKRFPEDLKQAAIDAVLQGETQTSVAKRYGVSPKTVSHWCIEYKANAPVEQISQDEQIAVLKKRLRQAEEEVAFLKKAAAYFAKHQ